MNSRRVREMKVFSRVVVRHRADDVGVAFVAELNTILMDALDDPVGAFSTPWPRCPFVPSSASSTCPYRTAQDWITRARAAGRLDGMNYAVGRQADG